MAEQGSEVRLRRIGTPDTRVRFSTLQRHSHRKQGAHDTLQHIPASVSIYSADGGQGSYSITGCIQLEIWYDNDMLYVRVIRAKGLARTKDGVSDPYVKLYLLPDNSRVTKKRTHVQRSTTNPIYKKIFKYPVPEFQVNKKILSASVWDWNILGNNLFLGEVQIPLYSVDLKNPAKKWHKLGEKKFKTDKEKRGKILLSMKYDNENESLLIKVKQAVGLLQVNCVADPNFFVRLFLLPKNRYDLANKTTHVTNTLNPTWNQYFEYESIPWEELKMNRVLELTVWNCDDLGCNNFVGCVRIGPVADNRIDWMDSTNKETKFWAQMLAYPGTWVDVSLELRPFIKSLFSLFSFIHDDRDTRHKRWSHEKCYSTSTLKSATFSSAKEMRLHLGENPFEDHSDSSDSDMSLYSEGDIWHYYTITGELQLKIIYEEGFLHVDVLQAQHLAPVNSNGLSNPYAKLFLMENKKKKLTWKTGVHLKTLSPAFRDHFECELDCSQLHLYSLWFSLWDWNRLGEDKFLGEVEISVTDATRHGTSQWYILTGNSAQCLTESSFEISQVGILTLGLKFEPPILKGKRKRTSGMLRVYIKNATGLPSRRHQGTRNCFVKTYLMPSMKSIQTVLVKSDTKTVWNEVFEFNNVTHDQLSSTNYLEVSIWEQISQSSVNFIGGFQIGPGPTVARTHEWHESIERESRHWEEMLENPGTWVEYSHPAKSSLYYRRYCIAEFSEAALMEDSDTDLMTAENTLKSTMEATPLPSRDSNHKDSPGWLTLSIMYKELEITDRETFGKLHFKIEGAKLVPHLMPVESADFFVNIYLLPRQAVPALSFVNRRKTFPKKNTLNPVWNQSFMYENLTLDQLYKEHVLEVTLWNHSMADEKNFVGGLRIGPTPYFGQPNEWMDSTAEESTHWDNVLTSPNQWVAQSHMLRPSMESRSMTTHKRITYIPEIEEKQEKKEVASGRLSIGLMFEGGSLKSEGETKGNLHIRILNAMELSLKSNQTPIEIFVNIFFLPILASDIYTCKRKTRKVKEGVNPVWGETFVFDDICCEKLYMEHGLEVTMWNKNMSFSHNFIGGLRLGPIPSAGIRKAWMDSTLLENLHWQEMLACPDQWTEHSHILRPSMEYQDISDTKK